MTAADLRGSTSARRRLRLLVLMHVDWNWIRQRPQAIAEELDATRDLEVRVAYLPNWRRGDLAGRPSRVRRTPVPRFPYERFGLVRRVNAVLGRLFMTAFTRAWRPDATLITFPTLVRMLPKPTARTRLFYDCMDLATGFARSDAERHDLARAEAEVLETAAAVFTSSQYLTDSVRSRARATLPIVLVRNGYGGGLRRVIHGAHGDTLRLGYFGTVSSWFDVALVRDLLAANRDLEFHLWGPVADQPPMLERLVLHGSVPHDRLPELAADVHALVMPFVISDLIRGVDPVKLYEYVAFGRPVISVWYPELEPFRGLVHFYSTSHEFSRLLAGLREDAEAMAPDPEAARLFLDSSTWSSRATVMAEAIRLAVRGGGAS